MKNKKIELLKKKLSMLALATSLSVTSLSGCSNSELSNEEETKIENETFLVNDEISQEELETISYETNEEENKDEIDYEEDFKFSIHLNQASNVCTIDISLCCTEQDIKKIQMFLRDNQENIYSVSLNSSSVYDNKTIIKEILKTISNNKNVTQLDLQDLDMDVADIASMSQLKKLCLISGTIDNIDLINQFTQLESLYLYLDDENTDNLNIISNLSQLKELVVTNLEDDQHINNIEILRKFTNLERLDLFNNNISDISPIAELKKLQYLNISYNVNPVGINVDTEEMQDYIELDIPITNTVTEVDEKYENTTAGNINPKIENIVGQKAMLYALGGVCIIAVIVVIILRIRKGKQSINMEDLYQKNINKILKYYKDLIVTIENEPDITNLKIMNVTTIDDLIDVAEQNKSNIIHYEFIKSRVSKLYVIAGEYVYIYEITANKIK